MSAQIEPQAYDLAFFCKTYGISHGFACLEIRDERYSLVSRAVAKLRSAASKAPSLM